MARNEEKSHTMMNRWTSFKEDSEKGKRDDFRPFLASECSKLPEAERWRRDVIKETGKKVATIQNAGLGEHRLRDLNDEINKLLRERGHWEKRIVELGGGDYSKSAPKAYDAEGRVLPGTGGYKYFGAAKELPGVRELFQAEKPKPFKRTRGDLYKGIQPDYYGYRDEDDGVLVRAEAAAERKMYASEVTRIKRRLGDEAKKRAAAGEPPLVLEDISTGALPASAGGARGGGGGGEGGEEAAVFKSFVNVPSQEDIQKVLLERKKQELLAKYGSA